MGETYRQTADRVLGMLQHADGNDPSCGHLTMNNWEWPTGVALYGIYKTYQQSGDRSILDYLTGWYDDMLSRPEKPHRNVNTVAPVLTLTCLYDETKNEKYLPEIESWLEWVLTEMPRTEYGGLQHCTVWNKHYQQLWCDTLFMVCLFLAKAGVVLDRPALIEEAEYQFLIHIRYLQNKVNGLFYHGWTFDRRHNFAEAFWARGNAWFTVAAIELFDITKRDDAAMRMIRTAWTLCMNCTPSISAISISSLLAVISASPLKWRIVTSECSCRMAVRAASMATFPAPTIATLLPSRNVSGDFR